MKILMISVPFTGHVNPTLGLARAFVEQGHSVAFILTTEWQEAICKAGANFIPYDDFPSKPTPIEARLSSIKAAYNTALRIGENYDCIIYEMLFFPGRALADKLKLPAIRLFSTFALDDDILRQFVKTGGPLMGLFRSKAVRKKLTAKLIGDAHIKCGDLLMEIGQNPADLNFVFTTREFQINNDRFPNDKFKFIGPSITARESSLVIPFAALAHPLIYISLGSMLNNAKGFYKRCFAAFKNENVSVIMSVGSKIRVDELGEIPMNFKLYSFVPQLEVLENADLFITHGGMNSVNEALYYGVPMVVLPLATDQPTVAERIVALNLGRQFSNKRPSANEIRAKALTVLADKTILSQAKQFQGITRRANGSEYAVGVIEKYVKKKSGNPRPDSSRS